MTTDYLSEVNQLLAKEYRNGNKKIYVNFFFHNSAQSGQPITLAVGNFHDRMLMMTQAIDGGGFKIHPLLEKTWEMTKVKVKRLSMDKGAKVSEFAKKFIDTQEIIEYISGHNQYLETIELFYEIYEEYRLTPLELLGGFRSELSRLFFSQGIDDMGGPAPVLRAYRALLNHTPHEKITPFTFNLGYVISLNTAMKLSLNYENKASSTLSRIVSINDKRKRERVLYFANDVRIDDWRNPFDVPPLSSLKYLMNLREDIPSSTNHAHADRLYKVPYIKMMGGSQPYGWIISKIWSSPDESEKETTEEQNRVKHSSIITANTPAKNGNIPSSYVEGGNI